MKHILLPLAILGSVLAAACQNAPCSSNADCKNGQVCEASDNGAVCVAGEGEGEGEGETDQSGLRLVEGAIRPGAGTVRGGNFTLTGSFSTSEPPITLSGADLTLSPNH